MLTTAPRAMSIRAMVEAGATIRSIKGALHASSSLVTAVAQNRLAKCQLCTADFYAVPNRLFCSQACGRAGRVRSALGRKCGKKPLPRACRKCGTTKNLHASRTRPGGLNRICRACNKVIRSGQAQPILRLHADGSPKTLSPTVGGYRGPGKPPEPIPPTPRKRGRPPGWRHDPEPTLGDLLSAPEELVRGAIIPERCDVCGAGKGNTLRLFDDVTGPAWCCKGCHAGYERLAAARRERKSQ